MGARVRLQIEALPGTVLTTLARRTFKEGTVLSFQGTRLDSIQMAMQKNRQIVFLLSQILQKHK